jgi:hypothetical protein
MKSRARGMSGLVVCVIIAIMLVGLAACQPGSRPGEAATSFLTETPLPPTPFVSPTPVIRPADGQSPTATGPAAPSAVPSPALHGLVLDPPAADGSVSGEYRPSEPDNPSVRFRVDAGGSAVFQVEGAPEEESLQVMLGDDGAATMVWKGTTLDGIGALTTEERAVMLDYFQQSDLLRGLSFVPMDIGCRGEEVVTDRQVAALVFPLQMHYKYMIADRQEMASYLMERSSCDYAELEELESAPPSAIQLSPAMPVPVVPGFFPLDEVGSLDAPPAPAPAPAPPSLGPDDPLRDWYGICNAKCRGACGADCEPNNCISTAELRCVKDENGQNTGYVEHVFIYDCGVHQGCIDHDACYDECNRTYGCDTWAAAICRHGQWTGAALVFENGYCDQRAIEQYGLAIASAWAYGYGPQPMREIFEYTDLNFQKVQHLEKCPVEQSGGGAQPAPAATAIPTPAGPKWVRDDEPIINAEGLRLEYRGGGSQADFFGEARFEGMFTIYSLSETSIGVEDRWVDHEWEAYHVNIISTFDVPPDVLIPGATYELQGKLSSSGTVAEGGGNPGVRFQYGPDRDYRGIVQPDAPLSYFPWEKGWNGPDSQTWTLTAPPARAGETFRLWAFWSGCPVCNVIWTYRAE